MSCTFPYLQPPLCQLTFAESLGATYDTFWYIWIVFSAMATLISLIQTSMLIYKIGFWNASDRKNLQREIHYGLVSVFFTYIVRAADVGGYRGVPLTLSQLCCPGGEYRSVRSGVLHICLVQAMHDLAAGIGIVLMMQASRHWVRIHFFPPPSLVSCECSFLMISRRRTCSLKHVQATNDLWMCGLDSAPT